MRTMRVIDYGQNFNNQPVTVNFATNTTWVMDYGIRPLCQKHHAIERIKQQPFF